jgi:hypothetical protein
VQPLVAERCFSHPDREAAARCSTCRRYFCRECVSEHAGLIVCGACLKKIPQAGAGPTGLWVRATLFLKPLGGATLLWLVFYLFGRSLLAVVRAFQ